MDCKVRKHLHFPTADISVSEFCYLVWNFLQAVQSPDMIQCIYGWREATVEAEYLFQKEKSNPLSGSNDLQTSCV